MSVSEKAFQQQVKDLARLAGWRTYHTYRSTRSAAGFPDLVLVRPPAIIFAKLKSENGRLRPEQAAWLEALRECPGVKARLWRPTDWPEIKEALCRRSRRKEGESRG